MHLSERCSNVATLPLERDPVTRPAGSGQGGFPEKPPTTNNKKEQQTTKEEKEKMVGERLF